MRLSSLVQFEKNARRLSEILGILGKYGLADLLSGIPSRWIRSHLVSAEGQAIRGEPFEARVRMALSDLGPTFIKFGQMLSTRGDLLNPELIAELEKLQESIAADSTETVVQTIERELGHSLASLFAEFEETPMASASIAQVHRARLNDGRCVVIKVQHTEISKRVRCDLDLMAGLAELLQKNMPSLRPFRPVALVREFRRTLLKELDFLAELRNLERFRQNFASNPHVDFPEPHPELCTRSVLTMEYLQGIHGTDLKALRESGVNFEEFIKRAGLMYLDMIFRDGFYHADPHPGNFVLMDEGVLGVIDCGMVGRLDEVFREDFEDFLLGVVRNDPVALTTSVLRLANTPACLDEAALQAELAELADDVAGQSLSQFDLAGTLRQVVDIIHRFRIILPPTATLLIKTLIMLEGTGRRFQPSFSLFQLLEKYQGVAIGRRFLPLRWKKKVERSARDWDRIFMRLPKEMGQVFDRLRAGTLEIHHVHRQLEETVNRLVTGLLAAALLVSSCLLLSQAGHEGFHASLVILGALGLSLALILLFKVLREIYGRRGPDLD